MKTTENQTTENFLPEQSFQIINSMIKTAQNKLAEDGFLIIFWGWLVFACALINYLAFKMGYMQAGFIWVIFMPLGGIFSAIYGSKQNKKEKVKTYVNDYLNYVWKAFGIALAIALISMPVNGMKATYFFLMVLYGIATLISGGILNFKPLIIGSLFSFACAIISVYFGEMEQFLWISLSLLCSYIIPGHMLRNKFNKEKDA